MASAGQVDYEAMASNVEGHQDEEVTGSDRQAGFPGSRHERVAGGAMPSRSARGSPSWADQSHPGANDESDGSTDLLQSR